MINPILRKPESMTQTTFPFQIWDCVAQIVSHLERPSLTESSFPTCNRSASSSFRGHKVRFLEIIYLSLPSCVRLLPTAFRNRSVGWSVEAS